MGKRGPPKTPTATLKARGSWHANDRNDPDLSMALPNCPDWLKGAGREHWFALLPLMAAGGILRQTDGPALARYCHLWKQWRECVDWLEKHGSHAIMSQQLRDENGLPELDENGEAKLIIMRVDEFPQAKLCIKLAESLNRLENNFGLSPSARASLGVAGSASKKEETGKGRFFNS